MRKFLVLYLLMFFALSAKAVTVPENTQINIGVKKLVQSKKIPKDYEIKATIKDNVVINGETIFQAGDKAILSLSDFTKAKFFARSGEIYINGGYVFDINGNGHSVRIEKEIKGEKICKAWALLIFKKGKQAKIYPSMTFETKLKSSFNFEKQKEVKDDAKDKSSNKGVSVEVNIRSF